MIQKHAGKVLRPALKSAGKSNRKAAVVVNETARRGEAAGRKALDDLVASMSPKKLSREIRRILHPDTALEVALSTNRKGLRPATGEALKHGMSLANTLQGRDTIAKAAAALGFPEVGARYLKALDILLVGTESQRQAQAYAKLLAQVDRPADMLRLLRSTPGALSPRTTLTQDINDAARQAFTGEFALFGPIHFPTWAGESIFNHLGVFNRLAR